MRLVIVEWVDSCGCETEWHGLTDAKVCRTVLCKSVGWLFKDETDVVVLVPNLAEVADGPNQGCGTMTIPKCCVRKITDIGITTKIERGGAVG